LCNEHRDDSVVELRSSNVWRKIEGTLCGLGKVEEGMKDSRCMFFVEESFAWKQRGSESTFPEQ